MSMYDWDTSQCIGSYCGYGNSDGSGDGRQGGIIDNGEAINGYVIDGYGDGDCDGTGLGFPYSGHGYWDIESNLSNGFGLGAGENNCSGYGDNDTYPPYLL